MKIYLLSGKARSGKGTIANIIKEYYGNKCIELMFAQTIKRYAKDYFGWDGSDETKPRELLQHMGTEVIRVKLNNPNFHLNRVHEDIDILKNYFDYFIISDCRFPNEANLSKNKFKDECVLIRVERDYTNLTENQQQHSSEMALDNYNKFDYIVENNKTIDDLKEKIIHIIEIEENKIFQRISVDETECV